MSGTLSSYLSELSFHLVFLLSQVSKLVILHEDAEDGNAMPDLARSVQVVKMAVDNLIKVGQA